MLHGRSDRTIRPDQAQRLYDAASEPKELRWYESGHVLPATAAEDAAGWLVKKFGR
jgi:predicted esterase